MGYRAPQRELLDMNHRRGGIGGSALVLGQGGHHHGYRSHTCGRWGRSHVVSRMGNARTGRVYVRSRTGCKVSGRGYVLSGRGFILSERGCIVSGRGYVKAEVNVRFCRPTSTLLDVDRILVNKAFNK